MILFFALSALITSSTPEVEISAQLAASLPSDLALVGVVVPSQIAGGRWAGITASFQAAPKPGRRTAVLVLTKEDGTKTKSWAQATLARRVQVAISARAKKAGEVLERRDVVLIESLEANAKTIDVEPLFGSALVRDLSAGVLIAAEDFAQAAPLPRGTLIQILARSGAIEIACQGTLDRTARIGVTTFARASGSQKPIRGRLVDSHTFLADGVEP